VVTVTDGRAVKLRGNPDHPYTAGGLCPKVNPWLEHGSDPSRLTEPLRRVGPKGQGRFEPVSWDDAMAEMAERLTAIIERSGGQAIWPYVGTGNLGWIQGSNGPARLWTRMGASAHHLSICSVAGREGIELSVGAGDWLDPEDVAAAGLVVIWGSNTLVTNRHLWPFVDRAREAGAPLVVVDPIRTRTAARADLHLAPRPGTDAALAFGLCRAIADRGGVDDRFVTGRAVGWDEFRAAVEPWDGDRTANVTGLTAGEIDRLADLLVASGPAAFRIGHGIQRQATGGNAMRVVSCIPAVLGAYDRPGGGSLYSSTGTPKGYNVERLRRPELGRRPRTLAMTNLAAALTGLDPPVEALIVSAANPLVSNPRPDLVARGLARDDLFTVVIELFPTETTAWADLVLPSTMQHEQLEITDAYNHRYLHWNEPAVAPPGLALPHTEIQRRLARAMGYTDAELYATDRELVADLLDSEVLRHAGITVETLSTRGWLPMPRRPEPAHRPFPTPSGRFEFVSERAEGAGHGRLPTSGAGREGSSPGRGRLALLATAGEHQINSTFGGTALTRRRWATPPVVLHPDDATSRGLADGDVVEVANQRGRFEARLSVSDTVRPGVAATVKGRWHHPLNTTVAERDADMANGAVFHDNAVTVRPVGSTAGSA
jgi:anaerobic selenocysteine-containing dehydrogenase